MTYLSFKEARTFACKLNLKKQKEWMEWSRGDPRPVNIPVNLRRVYRDAGWISIHDWLLGVKEQHWVAKADAAAETFRAANPEFVIQSGWSAQL